MMWFRAGLFGLCALVFWACGDPGEPVGPEVPTALPEFDADACRTLEAPSIDANAFATGETNNEVLFSEGVAWIVQSARGTVGRLGPDGYSQDFVDVGDGRNPWSVEVGGGAVLVTNLVSDSLTIADEATGSVLAEASDLGLKAPTGVAVAEGVALVASSHFIGPDYGPGLLHAVRILDEAPFYEDLGTVETSALNAFDIVFDADRRRFYVISSGTVGADEDSGAFAPLTGGAVDVVDLDALSDGLQPTDLRTVPLPLSPNNPFGGSPRTLILSPDGAAGYLPSGSSPQIYKVDLETLTLVRGTDDPIEAYLGEGNQLTGLAIRPDGVGYVTAFNQDALYLFDTTCDATVAGPFDLGKAAILEGPLDVAFDPLSGRAVVLMSIVNAAAIVTGGGPL